ncbi:hypothetical protein N478_10930 [Pseudoalteromonas luteoviolacea S4060-1]|uniref:Uncharacterized protein n=1 Tax=Pseudoalteromonas luteoviolacea S4060-1 TaxID=1365257 RepID=A0A167P7N8_9GAMM|nr:hypothetical protein N478_10930 [Pseudoalteromonas luteoviolacea S4060-1]
MEHKATDKIKKNIDKIKKTRPKWMEVMAQKLNLNYMNTYK